MIEAYAVAVRVRLINGVTAGLMSMSSAFARVHGDAKKLQSQLDSIKFKLAAGGALVAGGAFGFYLLDKAIKPATEYAHQLNIMHMAGLSNLDIAQATALAWKNTGDVITTTATGNLKAILDLKNVLGTMQDAKFALPIVTKIGAVMAASSESRLSNNSQDIAFSMAKALDIIGAARDPKTFEREAGLMSKVVTAFQNRVTPKQFQGVFQYARQAKFDLSDEFKYEFLPSLMLEMSSGNSSAGGGSRGVGPMLAAIYRVTNQGYINKKAVPLWEQLGLVAKGTALKTATEGTVTDPLKDRKLAAENPFLFATRVLEPAIKRAFGQNIDKGREREIIGELFRGNQLAAAAMMEFISKPQNYLRDQNIIRHAMPYNQAYEQAKRNDPNFQYAALHAQYENALTALGIAALPIVIKGTRMLAQMLQPLGAWMMQHATITKTLVLGFAALSGAMLFGGTVLLLSAAWSALALVLPVVGAGLSIAGSALGVLGGVIGALSIPVLAVVGSVAALGFAIYEMWKHWDSTKSIWTNIKNEFSMFVGWIYGKVKWLLSWLPGGGSKPLVTHATENGTSTTRVPGRGTTIRSPNRTTAAGRAAIDLATVHAVLARSAAASHPALQSVALKVLPVHITQPVHVIQQAQKALPAHVNNVHHTTDNSHTEHHTITGSLPLRTEDKAFFGSLRDSVRSVATASKDAHRSDTSDLKSFMSAVLAKLEQLSMSQPTIMMDGQKISDLVSRRQGSALSKPGTGPSGFDNLLTPFQPNMAY